MRFMRSARPPYAPTGNPPPITLPSVVRSGRTPRRPCAPPAPTRNPVITSSKMSSAPYWSETAERRVKIGIGRDEPGVPDVRLDDHRGNRVRMLAKQVGDGAGIVEGGGERQARERRRHARTVPQPQGRHAG